MKRLKSGTLFFTNHFGSANEFGMVIEDYRPRVYMQDPYRVLLASGRVGYLDRTYLLVDEEMEGLK
jgi:hypothetical protein